jgi:nitroreductase
MEEDRPAHQRFREVATAHRVRGAAHRVGIAAAPLRCYSSIMNPVIASLYERKSVRSFLARPISEDLRSLIIDAALQAPTAGNQTLYAILDIRDQRIKERLAVLCDDQPFIATAPMVYIFLADCRRWLTIYRAAGIEPRDPGAGDLMIALADGIIAAQNTVVAAEALGIGSCYIGDILERKEEVTELLALEPFLVPAAMVVYGYPTAHQMRRTKPRRIAPEVIVHTDRYREPDPDRLKDELTKVHEGRPRDTRPAEARPGDGGFHFETFVHAFHDRKYASDFVRELNRSAAAYLQAFL